MLSVLDKNPVQELAIAWVCEIVAVALGYFIRGFKDTKEISDNNYRLEVLEKYGTTWEDSHWANQ